MNKDNPKPIRILLVEDVSFDAELVQRELRKGGISFTIKQVADKPSYLKELEEFRPDLVLSDYSLPAFDGKKALEILRARTQEIPFIFVTGAMGEEWAIETLKSGATDYVLKHHLTRLVPAVRRALEEVEKRNELETTEEQLRQAQKMETVGTLAGGLAHDFNNVLGGIVGSLSLLRYKREKGKLTEEELDKYLEDISASAQRARDIVKQLLTMSRREELHLAPVDLNAGIEQVMDICKNTFEKCIELNPVYHLSPAKVYADPTQLEQVMLNLCVNAAHAMTIMRKKDEPWGGQLRLSLEQVTIDGKKSTSPHRRDMEEGTYWKLTVTDTGVGMDAKRRSKIFEPFFTTKNKVEGTGLGLSMVYSIIKQHKGYLHVDSRPGKGSSFHIYLPEYTTQPRAKAQTVTPRQSTRGEGLILVVEDEPIMNKIATHILQNSGYTVITATNGDEGIRQFQKHHEQLNMVLLDMLMPKKSGKDTYLEMKAVNPGVKVLLTSGFRRDDRVEEVVRLGVCGFIEKPYTFKQLALAVYNTIYPTGNREET